jgi:membrane-associated protease RseP (regulator of RpoE activity)
VTPTEGYLIALAVVIAYFAAIVVMHRRGLFGPDKPLSLFFGVAVMIKTRRGLGWLDRAGRFRRFWSAAGDVGIVLAGAGMAVIVGLLVLSAIIATRIPASQAPQVSEALGIPGINPIIPIGYGLIALVVGVVLHELMHGVIARSQNIGVKSVGILWFVVPVGAFVEQDDEQMQAAKRRPRARVAAAGILANFALAAVFLLLVSLLVSSSVVPAANGVGVGYVLPGYPAANASLAAGDIITSVNGTPVSNSLDLYDALDNTTANETVPLTYYVPSTGATVTRSVTLSDAGKYNGVSSDLGKGFLGVAPTLLTPAQLKEELVDPFHSPYPAGTLGPVLGAVYWLLLPFAGLEPVQGSTVGFFHVTGPLAVLGTGGFWILANVLFWISWMDLLLAMSNALPLIPLDGGLLFHDFAASVAHRIKKGWDEARLERFGSRAAVASSLIVFFLLVWQFVGPHL